MNWVIDKSKWLKIKPILYLLDHETTNSIIECIITYISLITDE